MVFSYRQSILYFFTTLIISVIGQNTCEDFSADQDCTKFIRCFHNLRIKFTCPPGTAWEDTLKTCAWKEYVESCNAQSPGDERKLADSTIETYEADRNALDDIPIGQTLAEARALGPIKTPKRYQCTFCIVGTCGVVGNTIQCFCGTNQCSSATAPPQSRGPCDQNPCLNGGQCIPNGPGFLCNCPATFVGNRCEAPAATPCQPNPCQNGGICTAQGTSFVCRCPATWTGRCCEIRVTTTTPFNPCAQSPCRNGGQCIPSGTSYLCQCPTGFYGTRCEMRNYCMPNPCANNGFCEQTTTGYICTCSYPYTGTNCQQIITTTVATTIATRAPCNVCPCVMTPCPTTVVTNPCMPNPCQNAGACGVQNHIARCWCTPYQAGYYCQYPRSGRSLISKTCNKTCLNGGNCYIDEKSGQARCSCSNEYYGTKCEFINRPKSCSPKNPCMNKAKCITTKSGSQCICQKGTSGVLCEKIQRSNIKQYCSLDCQAGGTCVYIKSQPKCRCPKGRTGRLCETRTGKSLSNDEDEIDML
ncbi:unnamed protein product [Rotaria sp. Silwood1]|nr:unnamed protein product [Rotaria sp. Silwood1]CAF3701084.1 unnamed protein product [Rotaria sp. Silwood1]CAF3733747.1 unnamed protein product [Rotaria sp. Silwood1]CAF4700471.1 unnamed protein product [Rotaria sp. Silwood1]